MVFLIVPDIEAALEPEVTPVNVGVEAGAFHVYKVPAGTMLPTNPTVGDTSNGVPLQVTVDNCPISAVGLTVTIKVKLAPTQLPDEGVTT